VNTPFWTCVIFLSLHHQGSEEPVHCCADAERSSGTLDHFDQIPSPLGRPVLRSKREMSLFPAKQASTTSSFSSLTGCRSRREGFLRGKAERTHCLRIAFCSCASLGMSSSFLVPLPVRVSRDHPSPNTVPSTTIRSNRTRKREGRFFEASAATAAALLIRAGPRLSQDLPTLCGSCQGRSAYPDPHELSQDGSSFAITRAEIQDAFACCGGKKDGGQLRGFVLYLKKAVSKGPVWSTFP